MPTPAHPLKETPRVPLPLLLGVIVIAVSLSAIFIRLTDAPGTVIALYRLALASLLMLPAAWRGLRRSEAVTARGLWLSVIAGVMLGWHFATWTTSLEYTSVAASVTLVTTNPLWIVLLLWLVRGRRPAGRTLSGVLTAVGGGVLIGLDGGAGPGGGDQAAFGNFLALAGAVCVSVNMLLGRAAQQSGLSLLAYSGISYLVATLSLLPLPALLGQSYGPYPASVFFWIFMLALVSQLVGHTAINYSLRFLDATIVSTVILLEPVVASLLAMLIFSEFPGALTALGAVVLLLGIWLVNSGSRPGGSRQQETAETVL